MGWQPGNEGWRPRPGSLGVLWIAVVALALAGCAKEEAQGQAAPAEAEIAPAEEG